jgi:hypothetical protein
MVETLRGFVDSAISWLIDGAISLFNTLLGGGQAREDAGVQDTQGATLVEREADLGKEDHRLKVVVDEQGRMTLMMASEWNVFPVTIRAIKDTHVAILNSRSQTNEATNLATEMDALISDAAEEGKSIQQGVANYGTTWKATDKGRAYGRERWRDVLLKLDTKLKDIAQRYNFDEVVPGVRVNVGDTFADLVRQEHMIVMQTLVRSGRRFGIKAKPANADNDPEHLRFFAYADYSTTWGPKSASNSSPISEPSDADLENLVNAILELGFAAQAMAKADKRAKTSGRAGTRAHWYLELFMQDLDLALRKLTATGGDKYGLLSEVFVDRNGKMVKRRAKNSLGVDVLLFRNGARILGLDLKTGKYWTAEKQRRLERILGVQVLQFGLDKWRTK